MNPPAAPPRRNGRINQLPYHMAGQYAARNGVGSSEHGERRRRAGWWPQWCARAFRLCAQLNKPVVPPVGRRFGVAWSDESAQAPSRRRANAGGEASATFGPLGETAHCDGAARDIRAMQTSVSWIDVEARADVRVTCRRYGMRESDAAVSQRWGQARTSRDAAATSEMTARNRLQQHGRVVNTS